MRIDLSPIQKLYDFWQIHYCKPDAIGGFMVATPIGKYDKDTILTRVREVGCFDGFMTIDKDTQLTSELLNKKPSFRLTPSNLDEFESID